MLIAVVVCAGALAMGREASAQSFMGCPLNRMPNQIVGCLEGKYREWEDGKRRAIEEGRAKLERELADRGRLIKSEAERAVLEANRRIGIEPFVNCIARARPADEVAALARRFASDPRGFLRAAFDDAMALAPAMTWVEPKLGGLPRPPRPGEIFDATWAKLERLAARSETMKCTLELLRPRAQPMKVAFVDSAPQFTASLGQSWQTGGEAVLASVVSKLLAAGLDRAALGADGVLVLKGALTERMLAPDKIQALADQVARLATQVAPGGAPLGELARRTKEALTSAAQVDADFYIDLFATWVKLAGHQLIRSDRPPGPGLPGGGWLADRLLDQLDWVPGEVNAVIGSVCGLVPEAGGALCAWALELNLRELWVQVARPAIKDAALAALQIAYDTGTDLMKDKLRSVVRPHAEWLRKQAGVFAPLLEALQQQLVTAFVDDVIKTTRVALDNYNRSVGQLVDAAVAARGP